MQTPGNNEQHQQTEKPKNMPRTAEEWLGTTKLLKTGAQLLSGLSKNKTRPPAASTEANKLRRRRRRNRFGASCPTSWSPSAAWIPPSALWQPGSIHPLTGFALTETAHPKGESPLRLKATLRCPKDDDVTDATCMGVSCLKGPPPNCGFAFQFSRTAAKRGGHPQKTPIQQGCGQPDMCGSRFFFVLHVTLPPTTRTSIAHNVVVVRVRILVEGLSRCRGFLRKHFWTAFSQSETCNLEQPPPVSIP